QCVRARDRVEVAREMEVDVIHRDDLREAAARRAALHAENRAKAWLADAQCDLVPHPPQCLRQSHGDGALPLTGRRRVRRRDDDEAAANGTLRNVERNLRLVLPIKIELVALEAELGGDV